MNARWMILTLALLSACSGTVTSPSQPVDSTPAPITPVGSWNLVTSETDLSCTQATLTLSESNTIINNPDTWLGNTGTGLAGSTSGCITLGPYRHAPLAIAEGLFKGNEVGLFLFYGDYPVVYYDAIMILAGTQSDANHMSGNIYSVPAASYEPLSSPIGTWSASR